MTKSNKIKYLNVNGKTFQSTILTPYFFFPLRAFLGFVAGAFLSINPEPPALARNSVSTLDLMVLSRA